MADAQIFDAQFREAVSLIDAGDNGALARMLAELPELVRERLETPGAWLRDQVGGTLNGFFQRPYLLWFVAEDPVRNGKTPANIADIAKTIIHAAQQQRVASLQEQLDYALTLVSWSWIARECGVQIGLIDVLVDAGASTAGNPDNALVNGNVAAAEHLVERGAPLTLAAALCLGRWSDLDRLAADSTDRQKQFAFVLAALRGNVEALRRMIALGVDVNRPSEDLYSHGTPLHHAVCSGSLDAVKALVDAGAKLDTKDTAWNGTPLGWAEHYVDEAKGKANSKEWPQIAEYLRERV